jgi:hypothetical protein
MLTKNNSAVNFIIKIVGNLPEIVNLTVNELDLYQSQC